MKLNLTLPNGKQPKARIERDRRRGQAIVEFALALPILLLIILGIIEVARLVFIYGAVVTASREAVRYGSVVGILNDDPDALRYQDCEGIKQTAQSVAFLPVIDPDDIIIEYDAGPDDLTDPLPTCTPNGDGVDLSVDLVDFERISVTVSASYETIVPIFPQITIDDITSKSSRTILGILEYESE